MNRPSAAATTAPRPSRILILLAAAWLIASIAIGGLTFDSTAQAAAPATTTTVTQP